MDLYTFLILGHLVGTILAVGSATFIEINLNNALRDGQVSPEEKVILGSTYTTLRIGLVLAVLTGFGFLFIYKLTGQTFRLYDQVLWAKLTMIVVVLINALLLQSRKVSLYWGSAISFVSWWGIALLGFFSSNSVRYTFVEIMVAYAVILVAGAYLLHVIRNFSKSKISV